MSVAEYKKKIKELDTRFARIQKEYERQCTIMETERAKMLKHGIEKVEDIEPAIDKLNLELSEMEAKLSNFLSKFEEKIKEIEVIIQ